MMMIAITFIKEVTTTYFTIGYGFALAGQLLQSYDRSQSPTSPTGKGNYNKVESEAHYMEARIALRVGEGFIASLALSASNK